MRFLPLLFLAWPIAEIATLIAVGSRLGILTTILLLIGAGFVGLFVVRLQGLRLFSQLQSELNAGRTPTGPIVRGAMTALAGFFFLIPGFLSDILGLLLLLPPVQSLAAAWLAANATVVSNVGGFRRRPADKGVVDLDPADFSRRDDSPWTSGSASQGDSPPRIDGR